VGTWRGPDAVRPGGLGIARVEGGPTVVAVVAVNAAGEPDDGLLDRLVDGGETWPAPGRVFGEERTNTTIGVIVTDATLDTTGCLLVAQSGHDGLGRALVPAHTRVDGDALVAAATCRRPVPPGLGPGGEVDRVRILAVAAVERAVRAAVSG
ncbi:MAG: peptidase S58 family protein, partial [Actinomyces sp.]